VSPYRRRDAIKALFLGLAIAAPASVPFWTWARALRALGLVGIVVVTFLLLAIGWGWSERRGRRTA
jgi:hypothetical protein